jgi:hypothetical protein
MHWTVLLPLLKPAAELLAGAVGAWLLHRIGSPTTHERAATLALIADAAAAVIVTRYPTADWAQLLRETISEIARAAGLPTSNRQALEREAVRALIAAGVTPNQLNARKP